MGWLAGYSRRKVITLTGGADGSQVDFQLLLSIAYDSDMLADFSDLRFTDADGETLIDAWLEDKTDGTSADVVVEFPSTPANGVEQTYYMYYGKSDALDDWDIGATFLFGDDFVNADKWTLGHTDDINIDTDKLRVLSTSNEAADSYVTSKPDFSTDFIFQFIYNRTAENSGERSTYMGVASGTNPVTSTNSIHFQEYKNGSSYYRCGSIVDGTAYFTSLLSDPSWNELYNIKFTKVGASVNCKIWDTSHSEADPNLNEDLTAKDSYEFPELTIALRSTGGDTGEFDDFRVRKYAANPPTYGFGSEENALTILDFERAGMRGAFRGIMRGVA